MRVNGKHYRTIWLNPKDEKIVQVIDQRYLPHKFVIENLKSSDETIPTIKEMQEALTFFEDLYKATQGKRYNEVRFEVEDLRKELEYEEEEQMEALEGLVKPKNLSFFKH